MRWNREGDFDAPISSAAVTYAVPVALLKATIGVESGFNPMAYNPNDPGGAWGLMQMIPTTARALGFQGDMSTLQTHPELAIQYGAMLLGQNLRRTGGVLADSVSAYNGGFRPSLGLGAVRPDGTYANQQYVDRVLEAYQYFLNQFTTPADAGGGADPVSAGSFRPDPPPNRRGTGGAPDRRGCSPFAWLS